MSLIREEQEDICVDKIFCCTMKERVLRNWKIRLGLVGLQVQHMSSQTLLIFIVVLDKYFDNSPDTSAGARVLVLLLLLSLGSLVGVSCTELIRMSRLEVQLKIAHNMGHSKDSNQVHLTERTKLDHYLVEGESYDFANPNHQKTDPEAETKLYYEIINDFENLSASNSRLFKASFWLDIVVSLLAISVGAMVQVDFDTPFLKILISVVVMIALCRLVVHNRWAIWRGLWFFVHKVICCQSCCNTNQPQEQEPLAQTYRIVNKNFVSARVDYTNTCSFSYCRRPLEVGKPIVRLDCPKKHCFHEHCYELYLSNPKKCPLCHKAN